MEVMQASAVKDDKVFHGVEKQGIADYFRQVFLEVKIVRPEWSISLGVVCGEISSSLNFKQGCQDAWEVLGEKEELVKLGVLTYSNEIIQQRERFILEYLSQDLEPLQVVSESCSAPYPKNSLFALPHAERIYFVQGLDYNGIEKKILAISFRHPEGQREYLIAVCYLASPEGQGGGAKKVLSQAAQSFTFH